MKKTLLIGSALVISFAGFSQSNAKLVVTKNNIISPGMKFKKAIVEGPSNSNITWKTTPNTAPTFTNSCPGSKQISSSWNAFGVGGSVSCPEQNCLIYNKDLNALMWYQRGSKDWPLIVNSGAEQATIINHPAPSPHFMYATNVLDSVINEGDNVAATTIGARFPGGSWLNPAGNTDYHHAYACGAGPYNAGSTWLGSVYVAKPLWSFSAVNHTMPTNDSLHVVSGALNAVHFMGHVGESTQEGAPNADMQQVGNMVMSTGYFVDSTLSNASATRETYGFILKGALTSTVGVVNWTVDATSLQVAFHNDGLSAANSLGNHVAGAPRLALVLMVCMDMLFI